MQPDLRNGRHDKEYNRNTGKGHRRLLHSGNRRYPIHGHTACLSRCGFSQLTNHRQRKEIELIFVLAQLDRGDELFVELADPSLDQPRRFYI